jgi:hypothetical protein
MALAKIELAVGSSKSPASSLNVASKPERTAAA